MEGLLILLAVVAVVWFIIGPLAVIGLWMRQRDLEESVRRLRRRIDQALPREPDRAAAPRPESRRGAPVTPMTRREVAKPNVATDIEEFLDDEPAPAASQIRQPPGYQPAAREPQAAFIDRDRDRSAVEDRAPSLEELLAGRWLTWVGALALVIGAGFFFKYAIEQGWIGPPMRVLIGVLVGCGGFAGGVYAMRRNYDALAQGLVGAGLGVLYFALWAGAKWFTPAVLPVETAFVGMCLGTVAALAFAAYFDAQAAAVLGLIGGFLTPLMLSRGVDQRWVLFPYILMLDLGVFGVAAFRRWTLLNLLAFAGTVCIWIGWLAIHYEPAKLSDTVVLMTAFFVVFALLGVWHHVVRRTEARPEDFVLVLATPVLYFAAILVLTRPDYHDWQGWMAVAMAAAYLAFTMTALAREGVDPQIPFAFGGLAVSFLTIAIPLHFTGHWVAIAYAAESLVLFEMGTRFGRVKLAWAGLGLLMVVYWILLSYAAMTFGDPGEFATYWVKRTPDAPPITPMLGETVRWTDLINGRSLSFLAAIIVTGVMAWESARRPDDGKGAGPLGQWLGWDRQNVVVGLGMAAAVLTAALLAVETFSMWHRLDGLPPALWTVWTAEAVLIGLGVFAAAGAVGNRTLDVLGASMFGLAGTLLLVGFLYTFTQWPQDLRDLTNTAAESAGWWMTPLVNPRGLAFLITIAGAGGAAALTRHRPEPGGENVADLPAVFGLAAVAVGWLWVTSETYAWGVVRGWDSGTSLAVTLVWVLYAVGVLVAGIAARSGNLRKLALGLFLLTTGKVFLFDVWQLDTRIRTFAFVVLGLALLLVSWLYRRHRESIREWIDAE